MGAGEPQRERGGGSPNGDPGGRRAYLQVCATCGDCGVHGIRWLTTCPLTESNTTVRLFFFFLMRNIWVLHITNSSNPWWPNSSTRPKVSLQNMKNLKKLTYKNIPIKSGAWHFLYIIHTDSEVLKICTNNHIHAIKFLWKKNFF